MKIDIRAKDCLYIELNGWTYYIDDSTNDQIVDKWESCDRCGVKIGIDDEIHYPNDKNVCGYCVEDKEVAK